MSEALRMLREKIAEYGHGGDRPSSPPAWMLACERELEVAERTIAAHLRAMEEKTRLANKANQQAGEIGELRGFEEICRAFDRRFGCDHTSNGGDDAMNLVRHVDELLDKVRTLTAERDAESEARRAAEGEAGALWTSISEMAERVRWCFVDRTMTFAEFIDAAIKWRDSLTTTAHPDTLRARLREAEREAARLRAELAGERWHCKACDVYHRQANGVCPKCVSADDRRAAILNRLCSPYCLSCGREEPAGSPACRCTDDR